MTLKQYLTLMGVLTLICWLAWLFVVLTIDPLVTNWIGFCIFYTSLALSVVGTAALVGFVVRFVILKHHLAYNAVKEAFRQSFLFAALIVSGLILQANDLLSWLNLFFLIAALSVMEYFMLGYNNNTVRKV